MASSSLRFEATPPCLTLSGTERLLYGSLLMFSSLIGMVGAVGQLQIWRRYLSNVDLRRKPSSNPHAVFSLALGNWISCVATLTIGVSVFFVDGPKVVNGSRKATVSSWQFYWIVPIQFLSNFGFIVASIWTCTYLADVCLQLYKINCIDSLYHGVSWLMAILLTSILQILRYYTGNSISVCNNQEVLSTIIVFWVSMLSTFVCFNAAILFAVDKKVKADLCVITNAFTVNQRRVLKRIRAKFFFLVFIFCICWLPTIVDGVTFLIYSDAKPLVYIGFIEVVVTPLQGAFNYFIFIPRQKPNQLASPLSDRKNTIMPYNIQQLYGASYESSLADSIGARVPKTSLGSTSIVSSFRFTPWLPDEMSPLLTSQQSSMTATVEESNSLDDSFVIGQLLGDGGYSI